MTSPRFPRFADILFLNPLRPAAWITAQADRQLRRLVRYVHERVPLYRALWDAAGVRIDRISDRRDLPRLPLIDKPRIVEAGDAALDASVPRDALLTMSTSGTSGRAIHVRRTKRELRAVRRSILRQLFFIGARPWHPFVTFASPWLQTRSGLFVQRFCRTRHLPASASLDEQVAALRDFRPRGLIGQTGGLYLLARELLRRGCPVPLRFVAPTGATLMPEMRRVMVEAFQAQPSDLYGAIEVGTIAWQCPRGAYHVDADRVIVEIVDDDGHPLPDGRFGHVVVTGLYAYSMPFIRYRLFDVAALATRICNCGCRFPVMEPIQGRVNDFLPTPAGDLVSPHFFFHIFDRAGQNPVKEWRLIQEDLCSLIYEYVPEDAFDHAALEHGMDLIRRRFGPACRVQPIRVDSVPASPTGKRTCIISRLRPGAIARWKPWIGEGVNEPAPAASRAAAAEEVAC